MNLTLTETLRRVLNGEQGVFSGVYTQEQDIPTKGYRVPVPVEMRLMVGLYCSYASEHARLHAEMEKLGETERSPKHSILHDYCKILGSTIVIDMSQFRPVGAGVYGLIISTEQFFWYPVIPDDPQKHPTLFDALLGKVLGNIIDIRV